MWLLAHWIPVLTRDFIGGTGVAIVIPVPVMERNKQEPLADIGDFRRRDDIATPGASFDRIAILNVIRQRVCL